MYVCICPMLVRARAGKGPGHICTHPSAAHGYPQDGRRRGGSTSPRTCSNAHERAGRPKQGKEAVPGEHGPPVRDLPGLCRPRIVLCTRAASPTGGRTCALHGDSTDTHLEAGNVLLFTGRAYLKDLRVRIALCSRLPGSSTLKTNRPNLRFFDFCVRRPSAT